MFSYLAVSVAHSWASPPCSMDHGCSSPVVLNLQQKSTGVSPPTLCSCSLQYPVSSPTGQATAVAEGVPHFR